jgi:hypothetical protein
MSNFFKTVAKVFSPIYSVYDAVFGSNDKPAPTTTAAAVDPAAAMQKKAEEERLRIGASYNGLAATILTGGLGESNNPHPTKNKTTGVSLGMS